MKYYTATIWRPNENESDHYDRVDCGIADEDFETWKKMKKRVIPIIVDDGDRVWLKAESIIDLTEKNYISGPDI